METNIIENNRLILDFMGVKPSKFGNEYSYIDGVFFSVNDPDEEKVMLSIAGYVKYNSSWDALMPVFKKLDEMVWDMESKGNDEKDHAYLLQEAILSLDIIEVYNKSVAAIKWHNEYQKIGKPTRFRDTDKHIAAINELTRTLNLHFYNSSERNDETDHCSVSRGGITIKIWLPNPADEQYADTFVVEIYNNLNDDILYLEDDKGVSQVKSVYAAVNLLSMYLIANGESTTAS